MDSFEVRQQRAHDQISKILAEENIGVRAKLRYTEHGIVADPVYFDSAPQEDNGEEPSTNTKAEESSESASGESATTAS